MLLKLGSTASEKVIATSVGAVATVLSTAGLALRRCAWAKAAPALPSRVAVMINGKVKRDIGISCQFIFMPGIAGLGVAPGALDAPMPAIGALRSSGGDLAKVRCNWTVSPRFSGAFRPVSMM